MDIPYGWEGGGKTMVSIHREFGKNQSFEEWENSGKADPKAIAAIPRQVEAFAVDFPSSRIH